MYIDECSFNLNIQSSFYGWGPRGQVLYQEVPIKQVNTSLCAAIDSEGLVALQIFDSSMKW